MKKLVVGALFVVLSACTVTSSYCCECGSKALIITAEKEKWSALKDAEMVAKIMRCKSNLGSVIDEKLKEHTEGVCQLVK
jgi:hypothetical protein